MNLLDMLFPPKKKDKDSPSAIFDDEDVQRYFRNPSVNNYIKKLLMCESKSYLTNADMAKLKEAYDKAHDIRKFEIELYWKRTTYVWTLIAALITVSGVLLSSYFRFKSPDESPDALLTVVAVVAIFGLFVTVISERILKSGEYWQKNWEYHVNLLEPFFSGRLYGTLLNDKKERYSIAKLNNILYKIVLAVWILVAEVIYKILYEASDIYHFMIPLVAFGFVIAIIANAIDYITLRKSKAVNVFLSQWSVAMIEGNKPPTKRKRFFNIKRIENKE